MASSEGSGGALLVLSLESSDGTVDSVVLLSDELLSDVLGTVEDVVEDGVEELASLEELDSDDEVEEP